MLSLEEIKTLIENDEVSEKKKRARVGQRYYEGEHDIKDARIFFINADGKLQEDENRSNIKISHPFFTENVDQEVQYVLSGKDGFVKSDIPELQDELDAYFNDNENFMAELYDVCAGCIAKGFDNMYAYKNAEGRTCFMYADSLGVVEVRATEADDGCEYVIRHYPDRIGKDGNKIIRIEVWDSTQTYFYVREEDGGEIKKDKSKKMNPRPHSTYRKTGSKKLYYEDYGFIPFFRMDYNRKQVSGLKPIKALIDDYDTMACGLSNNIQDTNEALYVVRGFSGDNLDELMMNIRAKKHIGLDEEGGVDIKTVDIPYQARQAKLDIDKEGIYHFGMAVNTAGLKDSSATVSIQVKSAYALLDMKANKFEIRLKQFMRKLLDVVLKEINEEQGTDYRQSDVYFNFEREIPTNAQENAQIELLEAQRKQTEITTLLSLATQIGNELMVQQIFDVLDLDYEEWKDKLPDPENDTSMYEAKQGLEGAVIEEEPPVDDGGGVIE